MIQISNISINNSFQTKQEYILKVMAGYTFVQIVWFCWCRSKYPILFKNNSKALGWLLTWSIACVITPFGIPFAVQVLVKENQSWLNNTISYTLAACFLAYLFCDTILGSVYYPSRFGIVTGWIHHLIYIWIIYEFMANSILQFTLGIPGLLGTFCVLEIPTFPLALGEVFADGRKSEPQMASQLHIWQSILSYESRLSFLSDSKDFSNSRHKFSFFVLCCVIFSNALLLV